MINVLSVVINGLIILIINIFTMNIEHPKWYTTLTSIFASLSGLYVLLKWLGIL